MPLKIFAQQATQGFWDKVWKGQYSGDLHAYYASFRGDDTLKRAFFAYLPKNRRVLEAGCGLAPYVHLLMQNGFSAEGIDFAHNSVQAVRSARPDIRITEGNVFSLPYKNSEFGGYISLGVIEHFLDGQDTILKEAFRVLQPRGVLILSTPYFNLLRKIKNIFGVYTNLHGEFYEYMYTKQELLSMVTRAGFTPRAVSYYDVAKTIHDEIGLATHAVTSMRIQRSQSHATSHQSNTHRIKRVILNIAKYFINVVVVKRYFAHMIVVVAYKP